jgi:hypothetical protein
VSGQSEHGRDLVGELLADLEALLARAAGDEPPASLPELERPPAPRLTAWQRYAVELRDLCARVVEEADEETARAFWLFLIETAARHGQRAGGSSS